MIKYTLYIGLNDKDTKLQNIDTFEASKIVQNILTEKTGGGTIFNATGVYKHDDGTVIIENTLRVEIVAAAMDAVRAAAVRRFESEQRKVNKILDRIGRAYGMDKLGVYARFSNGETWYTKIA